MAAALDPEAVNRVLLLTDGLANEGMTDPAELERHAGELRARGVSTSTFGVGEDFDERLLGAMADAGGGAFRFIGTPEEIRALIGSEVGEILEVTARGTSSSGWPGPTASGSSASRRSRSSGRPRGAVVHVGDLVADQVLRFVLALGFPLGEIGREVGVELSVADRDGRLDGSATLTWTFADGATNDRQARDREVDRVVARTYADRALRDAVDLNRRGAVGRGPRDAPRRRTTGPRVRRVRRGPPRASSPSSSERRRRGPSSASSTSARAVLAVGLRPQVPGILGCRDAPA